MANLIGNAIGGILCGVVMDLLRLAFNEAFLGNSTFLIFRQQRFQHEHLIINQTWKVGQTKMIYNLPGNLF